MNINRLRIFGVLLTVTAMSITGGCSKSNVVVDTSNVVTPERKQASDLAMQQGMSETQRRAREEAAYKASRPK